MSLYYPLSPIHKVCPGCGGYGWIFGVSPLELCRQCDGIGRVFIDGGPSFGCKLTLEDCSPGQEVTLGTGDRALVVRHDMAGTATTMVRLFDPMYDEFSQAETSYPAVTGVVIVQSTAWHRLPAKETGRREDHLDPLQKRTETK